ncbi:MAG: alpha-L-fucosidase [Planctomycetota bacterium]
MLESQTLQTPGDTDWFVHDRFGMFIHWGLYAMPARGEWVMTREEIGRDTYRKKYFDRFDPDLYDPERWADAAANAGMKYFVITTKHHDGFCLWDSKHTDYKATKTPHGKDLIRPMVDAFSARGLRTGFYHSLLDWQHPQYIVDYKTHPERDALEPIEGVGKGGPVSEPKGGRYDGTDLNAGRDQSKYAAYMRDQVRELLTEFGDVAVMWFDFSFAGDDRFPRDDFRFNKGWEAWESDKLYAMIRELMPGVILTDRLDLELPLSGGDVKTPEQVQPKQWVTIEHEGKQVPVVWEACQTFSGSWGYHRDEFTWRSVRQLITTLIDCVSKGGNLLLNVGPTGRGELDYRAMDRLEGMGRWMHHHSRSIYGCTQAPDAFPCPTDCRLTYNPTTNRLYIHLLNYPYAFLVLDDPAYKERVEYAQLLHDASELSTDLPPFFKHQLDPNDEKLVIALPKNEPAGVEIPVIELFLKG